ncbi:Oidioi.mRNA.OKI2018_I69.chr2.g6728.t1.cds [Oikopleura dioica]|uniref:Oidioi.mRNA.OKI2018_I69.chr2.g6728.t1.cds n=1 Tax=Oikopleura dioica TaxID=34765 RepID=A0ABN7TAZ7_OIKDI|nr:Oidioi.mRNA.OKI2018_I69.chr2.g6728.t1.cds [Oikopleura dioica]
MTFIRENCLCSICGDILDDAVELKSCQHYFCHSCIFQWDKTQKTANKVCPECRTAYKFSDRQRPPRIFRKILCDLQLACPNALCTIVTNYDNFKKHQNVCECRKEQCDFCEEVLPKKDIPQHLEDCPKYLKTIIDNLSMKNDELTESIAALRIKLANSQACGYEKWIETKINDCVRYKRPAKLKILMNWPTESNHEVINSTEKSVNISNFSSWFNFEGGKLRLMAMVNIDEKGIEHKFVAMEIICAESTQTAHAVWKMTLSSADRVILSTKIFKVKSEEAHN